MGRTKEQNYEAGRILCDNLHGLAVALGGGRPRVPAKEAHHVHMCSVTAQSSAKDQRDAERYFKHLNRQFYAHLKAQGYHVPNDPPKKPRKSRKSRKSHTYGRKPGSIKDLPKKPRP